MRIMSTAVGFPSIASGESSLTGFISQVDGTPAYTGVFQGWASRSLYTYRWNPTIGPEWTRHARKNEVDKLVQLGSETQLLNPGNNAKIIITSTKLWGAYDIENRAYIPLEIGQGGTGGRSAAEARNNLQISRFQRSSDTRTIILSTDVQKDGCYLQVDADGQWGAFNPKTGRWQPLAVPQGGTGAASVDGARTNLGLGRDNSPQLNSLFLDRTSDSTSNYTTGGMLHTRLLANDSTVRLAADMYVQTFPNEQGRLTIRFTCGGENSTTKYLDLNSEGNLIVDSAILKSTLEKPLQINSANPAIRFNETDRPANTPAYTLIANGGNWFIHKSDYDDAGSTSTAISYNFANDRLDVQNLKASGLIRSCNNDAFVAWPLNDPSGGDGSLLKTPSLISRFNTRGSGARCALWLEEHVRYEHRAVIEVSGFGSTTQYWQFKSNGKISSTANGDVVFAGLSDINYKDNVVEYDGLQSLENINAMNLVRFTYKDDEQKRERRGVIAQQIREIDPCYVKESDASYQDENGNVVENKRLVLDTNPLLMDALCAIKVLSAQVVELKEENADLRADITSREEQITVLESEVSDLKKQIADLTLVVNSLLANRAQ
ncbi:tail fiber domain-containing protein [Escherichia coli]